MSIQITFSYDTMTAYLDSNTFITVRNFNIVDPDVGAGDVDTIRTTNVGTADGEIVDLSVR